MPHLLIVSAARRRPRRRPAESKSTFQQIRPGKVSSSFLSPLRFAIVYPTTKARLLLSILVPQPSRRIALPLFSIRHTAAHVKRFPCDTSTHGPRPTVCAIPPSLYKIRRQDRPRSWRQALWSLLSRAGSRPY